MNEMNARSYGSMKAHVSGTVTQILCSHEFFMMLE